MIEDVISTPEMVAIVLMCVVIGFVLAKITNKK